LLFSIQKRKEFRIYAGNIKTIYNSSSSKDVSKKIKFIPYRQGERLGSFTFSHKTYKDLGYKAKKKLEDYINEFKIKNEIRDN
jgi:hypothetical protein